MAFDPHLDVTRMDTGWLKAEQDESYQQLSTVPRDRKHELEQLRRERGRIKEDLRRQRSLAEEADRRLTSMGVLARARHKAEVERLRRRITDARRVEERLSDKLLGLATEEKDLALAQKERERWVRQHSPLLERGQRIENELGRRNKALLRDRENELPRYLEELVGRVPERPSEKSEWRQTVLAIEGYREKYGVKDQTRALAGSRRTPISDTRESGSKETSRIETNAATVAHETTMSASSAPWNYLRRET